MDMNGHAFLLVVVSVVALAAPGCSGKTPADTGCAAGHSPYEGRDVALRLRRYHDFDGSYRLPLGKIVVSWSGVCASGDALEALANQSSPSTPGLSDGGAFRAVRTGGAFLSWSPVCGEACQKPANVRVTVTAGCQLLSRGDAVNMTMPRYPIPPPQKISAKLMHVSQYEQLFAARLDLPPDTLVWAVLTADPVITSPPVSTPPPVQWTATAVDACTDWVSYRWAGTTEPAGWETIPDQSPGGT
jgi:hypothetical protein